VGGVAAQTTTVVSFRVRIDSVVVGSLISNRARWTFDFASCTGPLLQGSSQTNTVTTQVAAADLSISGSFLGAPAIPGAQVRYQLAVPNRGRSAVTGALPPEAGTTPALPGVPWTCPPVTASATCGQAGGTGPPNSTVSLVAGGSATFPTPGRLAANAPAGTITDTA